MSVIVDTSAPYNTVHCDWCQEYKHCRSLFDGEVWVMSICKECE